MRTRSTLMLLVSVWLAAQACTCGAPGGPADAGCGEDSCAACPPGCTSADACSGSEWACACTCAANAQNFCQLLAEKECDFALRCHSEPSLLGPDPSEGRGTPPLGYQDQVAPTERARCVAQLEDALACRQGLASFAAGRTSFDAVAFSACVASAYPGDTCARDFNAVQRDCLLRAFALPQAGAGALCTEDAECDGGFCSGASSCGSCQAQLGQNAPCTRAAECAAGTYCAIPSGQSSGTCLAEKGAGDPCNPYSITGQRSCGAGTICALQGGFIPSGSCQVGVPQGAACVPDRYQCARSNRALPELLCAPGTLPDGTASSVCLPLQSGPGGPCGTGELVLPSTSAGGTRGPVCRETETCVSGVCVPRKPAQAACASDGECALGTHCVDAGAGPRCQPFADVGQACTQSGDCRNLLGCDGGTCVPELASPGEACGAAGTSCAAGACDAGVCVALQPTGAGCGADAECASDVCSSTCSAACWAAP